MRKEFIALSWWILEQKYLYYFGFGDSDIHPSWLEHHAVSDSEYDEKERRYEFLAFKLGEDPTASTMVGFDPSRESCKLVMSRLKNPMPKKKEGK